MNLLAVYPERQRHVLQTQFIPLRSHVHHSVSSEVKFSRGPLLVDPVALGQSCLRQHLPSPPFSIIPPMLQSHLHLNDSLSEGREGEAWELSKKTVLRGISRGGGR
jgi:hypothetical protein